MGSHFKKDSRFLSIYSLGIIFCLFARFIPLRAPNVEPILAVAMPFSKIYGALITLSFALLSILLYDSITGTLGVHTFFTLAAYGVVTIWSAQYFKTRRASRGNFVKFAVMGTLAFDAATGLTVGPLFFNQSFMSALLGQIPFTVLHLLGNVAFAAILSPAIYHVVIRKKEPDKILQSVPRINPHTI